MLCSMNFATFGPFIEIIGIALTHFVKYFVAIIIKFWAPKEVGDIYPIISSDHLKKGHNDCMGCNTYDGWLNRLECCWYLRYFLIYLIQ